MSPLAKYILKAMLTWSPTANQPGRDVSHYDSIAEDVVAVAADPSEKTLYDDDADRAKSALQLAGVAALESNYWRVVDNGTCNGLHPEDNFGLDLLKKAGMDCDSHAAWSIWQIHLGKGLWLMGETFTSMGGVGDPITGPRLIADRRLAARLALHIMRASLRAKIGLCGYSGEKYSEEAPDHGCPLAAKRQAIARDYFKAHPYVSSEW
jgi:hypothetical protein